MKPNFFLLIIAFLLTSLISFTIYSYSLATTRNISTVFSFLTFFSYLGALIGVKFEYQKAQVLKNTLTIVFLLVNCILITIFLKIDYSLPIYFLLNGGILLIYYTILYFFNKSNM